MRVEVRSVAPDANPYLTLFSIFKTGIDGTIADVDNLRQAGRFLPDNIYTAIDDFKDSTWIRANSGSRRAKPVCRFEAGRGRPLPTTSWEHS